MMYKMLTRNFVVTVFVALATMLLVAGCSGESRSKRYLARADADYKAGLYERAEVEYIAALRAQPSSAPAAAGLGFVYFEQGKVPQAYGALTRALELDGANTEARLKLAIVCHSIGQLQKGREHALKILESKPGYGEALMVLVDCSTTPGDLAQCKELIDKVSAAERKTMTFHMAQAGLLFKQKDFVGAESEIMQASTIEPNSQRPYYALYSLYAAQKQQEKAAAALQKAAEVAPVRSVERLRYAQFKLQSGQSGQAKRIVTEMTQKAPDFIPAWVFLARTAFQERNFDQCSSLVTNILNRDPSNYEAYGLNAEILLLRGDITNALRHFEWIVQQYGTNTQHFYNLARAQVQNGQENQAIASLDRAILAYSNNIPAVLLQSSLFLRQGSFDRVAVTLRSLAARTSTLDKMEQAQLPHVLSLLARAQAGMKNYADAAATYQAMPKTFPGLPEVHLEAAAGLAALSRKEEAMRAYTDYVQLSTNRTGLVVAGRGLALLNDFPGAREALQKARSLSLDYMPALEGMIQLDLREKKYDAAIAQAQQEIQRDKSAGTPWLLLGGVYIERALDKARAAGVAKEEEHPLATPAVQQDVNLAEEALLKATNLEPGLNSAYRLLARLYVSSNKQKEALQELEAFVARTNDVTAYVQMALIHSQAKEHKTAAEIYEKALEFAPRSVEILNNLAVIYSDYIPRYDRAAELARRARRIAMDSPAVADTMGWVLHKQGDYSQALPLLEYAAKTLSLEPEVQFHLGMTYYMLGYESSARVALESAAASEDMPFKQQAAARLAVLALDPSTGSRAVNRAALEKRLAEQPGDVIALSRLATILEKEGSYTQAVEKHREILKWSPKNVPALLNTARICADYLNDTEKAMSFARLARNNAPEDPGIAHLMGRLALRSQNWSWAADLLAEAVRKLPEDPAVDYDFAWANYFLGKLPEAESRLKLALEHQGFREAGEARLFLKFLEAHGTPAAAEKLSGEAARKLESEKDPYLPALMVTALAEEHRGAYAKAADQYQLITKQWPLFSPAVRNLALISFEHLKDNKTAYDLAQKARAAYPNDARLARSLGILCLERGEHSRAVQLLIQASQGRADDAELFYYLGVAQKASRANKAARESFEKALSLKLNEDLAAKAARELANLEN